VAEKLSALRTEDYFRERAQRGDVSRAKRILKRAGTGNQPGPDDEEVVRTDSIIADTSISKINSCLIALHGAVLHDALTEIVARLNADSRTSSVASRMYILHKVGIAIKSYAGATHALDGPVANVVLNTGNPEGTQCHFQAWWGAK
jgi:hypothetical protein